MYYEINTKKQKQAEIENIHEKLSKDKIEKFTRIFNKLFSKEILTSKEENGTSDRYRPSSNPQIIIKNKKYTDNYKNYGITLPNDWILFE